MIEHISAQEHQDRLRRVRSIPCPKCNAGKGAPCRAPNGEAASVSHAARYQALYRKEASR